MRVVLDTNVVVSALLLPRSFSRQLFDRLRTQHQLLASRVTLAELHEVLTRPKFDRYVASPQRLEFLALYADLIELVEPTSRIHCCRDEDDNRLLEIAVDGAAQLVISGDHDLLSLGRQFAFAIMTPREALARL